MEDLKESLNMNPQKLTRTDMWRFETPSQTEEQINEKIDRVLRKEKSQQLEQGTQ